MSKEKKTKKKLIKVEGYSMPYRQIPQQISFSLVSKTDDGRKQALKFMTCRDYLNDVLHSRVHGQDCGSYSFSTDPVIDLDKLRLLIGRHFDDTGAREKFVENIFSAKRLLNLYEKIAGWDTSKITTVNHSLLKYNAWLITGPKEWISYPNLLSTITLVFRIVANHGPIETSSNEDVEKWFWTLMEEYESERRSSSLFQFDRDLSEHLPECWDKFYMIMKHHKDIFTQPVEKLYPGNAHIHAHGGIVQLCKFNTNNKILDDNMRKVYHEFKKEKYKTMDSDGTVYKLNSEFAEQKEMEDQQNRVNNLLW